MVPSGLPAPIDGSQSVPPVLLRSNSATLGSQGSLLPPQGAFSSFGPPQAQYNMNFLGHTPNISSLFNQTFGGGGLNTSISCLGGFQQESVDTTAGSDPLSNVENDSGFSPSPSFVAPSNIANSGSSDQVQNSQISTSFRNPMFPEQHQLQVKKLELQKFQHSQQPMQQSSVSHGQLQQHQVRRQFQQFQSIQGELGGVHSVKLEPQILNDQIGPQHRLQPVQNLGPVKLEPQQNQMGRGVQSLKLEDQHSDQAMLLQQQQQHFLQMSQQSSQAATAQINFLQQQQILRLQQREHQELFKTLPQQRPHLQQFQQQNFPIGSAMRPAYEPGMCAQRLTQYIYQQQHRPEDNSIEFWRKFVAEFFSPNAKKKWCVSLYANSRLTNGVLPQDIWHCGICTCKPGRGFETTVEVLPRLFKIKYDSGTLQELLYVDMPREYENTSGQIVLDYAKAIQESVFEHLRVVRDGQLRLIFSRDLKICSWEFCARRHEELIPRRIVIPQLSQVGAAAQKYQASAQNASTNSSAQDLQSNCNMFVASARQLAKALEVPLVNDLGYTKRYVRCLQIAEVVDIMKDLIDYGRVTGKGPMESLANFPCGTGSLSGLHNSAMKTEERQQITGQNLINEHSLTMQPSASNCVANVNNSQSPTSTLTSATNVVGLLHENSMNSRHENHMNSPTSPYAGTPVRIPPAGSSTTLPPSQLNSSSPFLSPTPSASNNLPQTSYNALTSSATTNPVNSASSPAQIPLQHSAQSKEANHEYPSSVEKILREIVNSSQYSGENSMVSVGSLGSNMNNVNGLSGSLTNTKSLVGNGVNNNYGIHGGGLGNFGGEVGFSTAASGIRAAMGNNSGTLAGRVGLPLRPQGASMNLQQQEVASRLLNGLEGVNGFNNPQFNWKYP